MEKNRIEDIFGKGFMIYNAIIFLLMMPLACLSNVTKSPVFTILLIVEMILVVINGVYIIYKLILFIISGKRNRHDK